LQDRNLAGLLRLRRHRLLRVKARPRRERRKQSNRNEDQNRFMRGQRAARRFGVVGRYRFKNSSRAASAA